jgi:hypothetical protein
MTITDPQAGPSGGRVARGPDSTRPRLFRRLARAALWFVGVIRAVVPAAVVYAAAIPPRYSVEAPTVRVEPTPARVARGKSLASVLSCVQCHADPATGAE